MRLAHVEAVARFRPRRAKDGRAARGEALGEGAAGGGGGLREDTRGRRPRPQPPGDRCRTALRCARASVLRCTHSDQDCLRSREYTNILYIPASLQILLRRSYVGIWILEHLVFGIASLDFRGILPHARTFVSLVWTHFSQRNSFGIFKLEDCRNVNIVAIIGLFINLYLNYNIWDFFVYAYQ